MNGPIGELRADYHAAVIAATIANVFRSEDMDPHVVEEFLLRFTSAEREPMTARDMRSMAKTITDADDAARG